MLGYLCFRVYDYSRDCVLVKISLPVSPIVGNLITKALANELLCRYPVYRHALMSYYIIQRVITGI